MARIRQLPEKVQGLLEPYTDYTMPELEQRLGKSRTKGTLIELLPKDLQQELFLRSFHCNFKSTYQVISPLTTLLHIRCPDHVITIRIKAQELREINADERYRFSVSKFLEDIVIGRDASIPISNGDSIEYYSDNNTLEISGEMGSITFPLCVELLLTLQEIFFEIFRTRIV